MVRKKKIVLRGVESTREHTDIIYLMTRLRRNTIRKAAAVILCGSSVLFLNPTQVLADRDANLQEKYFLNQLNSRKKKRGFLFGKKNNNNNNNDPAVKYQRQQQTGTTRLLNSTLIIFAIFAAWLAALWIFRISSAEMMTMIGNLCNQISEVTGSFARRTNETSRRKRDRNNNNNMSPRRAKRNSNNNQSSRQRNSFSDNQSITSSVLEIIDMETIVDDDSASSYTTGVISKISDAMVRVRKKFMSPPKPKDTPDNNHNQQMDHLSSSRNRKSHRDNSSLRLRASGKQKSVRKDEELGENDKSKVILPGFLDFIEEDERSDNGTEFGIVEIPKRSSSKRDKHAQTKTHSHDEYHRKESNGSAPSKLRGSPLQKKISCGSEDAKKHRSHHHSSHRHDNSRRHTKHRTSS